VALPQAECFVLEDLVALLLHFLLQIPEKIHVLPHQCECAVLGGNTGVPDSPKQPAVGNVESNYTHVDPTLVLGGERVAAQVVADMVAIVLLLSDDWSAGDLLVKLDFLHESPDDPLRCLLA